MFCPLTGYPSACLVFSKDSADSTPSAINVDARGQSKDQNTHLLPRYVPTCLKCAISPCTFRSRSDSIISPSSGSTAASTCTCLPTSFPLFFAVLGPAPGVDRGVARGRGAVEGDERKAERAVTWGSVSSETLVARGIWSRARRREEVWCDTP